MQWFCTQCFASELDGSWGYTAGEHHCTNCGSGGTTVQIPSWAVDSIRRNASWVGKRYYPCDEDYERSEERISLMKLVVNFPGRTATLVPAKDCDVWNVTQEAPGGRRVTTSLVDTKEVTTEDDAKRAAWMLTYYSEEDLGIEPSKEISTFDCDGVVFINKEIKGVHPGPHDMIVTGRSYEELDETMDMLTKRGIRNVVCFNPRKYDEKTRESSGEHKAETIKRLQREGYKIRAHYEDDEVQAAVIRRECPDVPVIMVIHDLTNKENQRNLDY